MYEPSDEELLLAYGRGQDLAFDALFRRHGTSVKAYALRMLRSPPEAEDVLVETFVRVAQARGRWAERGTFRGFLFRVAHNLCIDALRERARTRRALDHVVDIEDSLSFRPSPEAEAILGETAAALEAALARLPAEHREVMLLRVVHGLSGEEVAQVVGLDEGQVRSQLSYARKQIRESLSRVEAPRAGRRRGGEGAP